MKQVLNPLLIALILPLVLHITCPAYPETRALPDHTTAWISNPEHWVDDRYDLTAPTTATGVFEHVTVNGNGLVLHSEALSRYPAEGRWTGPEFESAAPFVELLPSWNVDAPAGTGLALEVKVRDAGLAAWSPWLRIGEWGRVEAWRGGSTSFDRGRVEIDVLRLDRPADAFQMRVTLQSHDTDPAATPRLSRLVVVTSHKNSDEASTQSRHLESTAPAPEQWARDLPVPFFTQQDNPEALRPRTCSPTATAMVMAYRGVELTITETALAIYDPEYAIFGNWGRAVAWASQHGLDAELARLRDWRQVEQLIADGQPIIASIKFESGTFPSNVMDSTDGHLIVIRGLTPEGDAIVNDPASTEHGDGVVYKKEELAAAWFGNGGVSYLIRGPRDLTER